MAGVEVAGLVFGVLPVLFETVHAYSKARDSLHTFRHWAKEVRTISTELKIQRQVFINECLLFLQKAVDAEAARDMIRNRNDELWKSPDLDRRLGVVLEDNLEPYRNIITATNEIVGSIEEEMNKFRVLREHQGDNENIKHVMKRIRGAVKITFDKSRHEENLEKLRARNGQLGALREQTAALQQNAYPSHFSAQEPPIWLYVQSMTATSNDSLQAATTASSLSTIQTSVSSALPISKPANHLKKKASSDLAQPSSSGKKAKRGPSNDASTAGSSAARSSMVDLTSPITSALNLCMQTSICNYLKQTSLMCDMSLVRRCLGYLETPDSYKHMFFARHKTPKRPKYDTIHSVFDVMQQDVKDAISEVDQLKLAHKTALALLQYSNTPWLSECWRLDQLSYFGNYKKFDDTSLETLHISSRITAPGQPAAMAMDGVESTTGLSNDIRYGINNLPIFHLGVALVEIAHWKRIEDNMADGVDDNSVYAARRLASGRALLGPVYQQIARKCLQCNFGVGTDLSKKTLQAAVYNDVVCELEGMIKQLGS